MQIWCAAGVALHGGRTKDGGYIVGDSVFYSDLPEDTSEEAPPNTNRVDLLDYELRVRLWFDLWCIFQLILTACIFFITSAF